MENIKLILSIIPVVLSCVISTITLLVKFFNANKARKAALAEAERAQAEAERAQAEAEREKAENDMIETAQDLVEIAEETFAGFDAVMKAQGSSAGAMKKDTVFTKLQTYALQHGYTFDADYWSAKIDEIVAFTRNVNAKEKTENADKTA